MCIPNRLNLLNLLTYIIAKKELLCPKNSNIPGDACSVA